MTLRRLLSHSAGTTVHGFPGYSVTEPRADGRADSRRREAREHRARARRPRPRDEDALQRRRPTLVQLMMVDQLKKPFPQIMRETVLAPLGLKHSTYEQPLPPALAAKAATGTAASGAASRAGWHVYPEMAAAGLWTTPSDLARIAIEVSKAEAGTSPALLSQAMAKQMLTQQSGEFGLGF